MDSLQPSLVGILELDQRDPLSQTREGPVKLRVSDVDVTFSEVSCGPSVQQSKDCKCEGCDSAQALCCRPDCDRHWVDLEFLIWWRNGRRFPPLVTTQPDAGVLPGATVLFGGEETDEQGRAGGRLEFGLWLDSCQCVGIGAHLVAVDDATVRFAADSDDYSHVARPFFDTNTNSNNALQIINTSHPTVTGRLDLQSDSDMLASDFFVRRALWRDCCTQTDFVFGYQFGRIDENLIISSFSDYIAMGSFSVMDSFACRNEFHGGHFGLRSEYRCGCWALEFLAKFGFGNMRQAVLIDGSTTVVDMIGGTVTRDSGLLAQASTNGGRHVRNAFSFMEDVGVKLTYSPTERLELSFGYSFMFWSGVARPGDHIDLGVDARLLTGMPPADATRPAFVFDPTCYYIHGMNVGAEYRF